jgi:hypothetical protein
MDLMAAVANIRQHLEAVKADVEAKLEQDLPQVEQWAHAASTNPAVAALSAAVHLPEAPEALAALAGFINAVDTAIGNAKAAAAAQAHEPADVPLGEPAAA